MRLLHVLLAIVSAAGAVNGFHPGVTTGLAFQRSKSHLLIPRGGRTAKAPLGAPPLTATAAETPSEQPWTKPRLHNNPLVRSASVLSALTLAGMSSPFGKLSSTTLATVHLLSFATWFGTVFYTTFIAGITMFKALPRQTFGKLQSKLFPKYFSLCSLSIVLQLITVKRLAKLFSPLAFRALSVSLVMTLLNQFLLEPKSTKIMFERYELENSDDPDAAMETSEYKALRASFGKLHGMSSLTNLIALLGAAVHGSCLSSLLV